MSLEVPTFEECCETMGPGGGAKVPDEHLIFGPSGLCLDGRYGPGKRWKEIYDRGLCWNCGIRPASITWGDTMTVLHGGGSKHCDLCVADAQLAHGLNRVKALPRLFYCYVRAWVLDLPRRIW